MAEQRGLTAYLSAGTREIRSNWRIVLRLSIAPTLAWWLSMQVFGHTQAFFAPIAAILTLTVGVGKRARVLVEIILGAALGVLVGELLILAIGRGAWQLILIVALAVITSSFLRMSGLALTQASISGVLLVAIGPEAGMADPAVTRFVDAFLGGTVALAMIALVPANPVRDLDRAAQQVREEFVAVLEQIVEAMRGFEVDLAEAALGRARSTQPLVDSTTATAGSLSETARLSPLRWRQRDEVTERVKGLVELDHALRNTRVLARRVASMVRHGEQIPGELITCVAELAELTRSDPENTQSLVAIAHRAVTTATTELSINTASLAAQIRAMVADLLLAARVPPPELDILLDVQ